MEEGCRREAEGGWDKEDQGCEEWEEAPGGVRVARGICVRDHRRGRRGRLREGDCSTVPSEQVRQGSQQDFKDPWI